LKGNKEIIACFPNGLKGVLELDSRASVTNNGIQKYSFEVSAKGMEIDGYKPNNLVFQGSGDDQSLKIQKFNLGLPPDMGDLPEWNQTLKSEQITVDLNQKTFVDKTPYEMVDTVGNIFNRLVIFDGGLIHAASEYFGWDIPSSRLFHMYFFN
jgi:hypothetical protein